MASSSLASIALTGANSAVPRIPQVRNLPKGRPLALPKTLKASILLPEIVATPFGVTKVSGRSPRPLLVRAQSSDEPTETPAGFGLGGPGTWFGFGDRQERNVGRLAMGGFVAALVMEVLTGKGVFGQLGLNPEVVRAPFLVSLAFLFVGGLLGGLVVINNPPDFEKVPVNDGQGIPRDPLKTFDSTYMDPLTTYTRGKEGDEPYASDLETPKK